MNESHTTMEGRNQQQKRKGWIAIPHAWWALPISSNAKVVLGFIKSCSEKFKITKGAIIKGTHSPQSTVDRALHELRYYGILDRYKINSSDLWLLDKPEWTRDAMKTAPNGVCKLHPMGCTKYIREYQQENSLEPHESQDDWHGPVEGKSSLNMIDDDLIKNEIYNSNHGVRILRERI